MDWRDVAERALRDRVLDNYKSFSLNVLIEDSKNPLNPSVTRSNRISPVTSECPARNPDAGRRLPAFIFISVYQSNGSGDILASESCCYNFVSGLIQFHITLQYRV
jgi:hypothetical protein